MVYAVSLLMGDALEASSLGRRSAKQMTAGNNRSERRPPPASMWFGQNHLHRKEGHTEPLLTTLYWEGDKLYRHCFLRVRWCVGKELGYKTAVLLPRQAGCSFCTTEVGG